MTVTTGEWGVNWHLACRGQGSYFIFYNAQDSPHTPTPPKKTEYDPGPNVIVTRLRIPGLDKAVKRDYKIYIEFITQLQISTMHLIYVICDFRSCINI